MIEDNLPMYQLSKAEVYWEKIQSEKRILESTDSKNPIDTYFHELAEKSIKHYESNLAEELMHQYGDLREYIRELSVLAYKGLNADVIKLRQNNMILLNEVDSLTKRIEKLTKKPKAKKSK